MRDSCSNETRWNGNFRMCQRYLLFKDDLAKLALEKNSTGREIAALLPSPLEISDIIRLDEDLSKFNSVSLLLQKKDGIFNHADVRNMFDKLLVS